MLGKTRFNLLLVANQCDLDIESAGCLDCSFDDDVRSVVASPIGTFCVGAGLALNAAGWWWMRRIVGVPS